MSWHTHHCHAQAAARAACRCMTRQDGYHYGEREERREGGIRPRQRVRGGGVCVNQLIENHRHQLSKGKFGISCPDIKASIPIFCRIRITEGREQWRITERGPALPPCHHAHLPQTTQNTHTHTKCPVPFSSSLFHIEE